MATLNINIGLSVSKELGQKTTRYAQNSSASAISELGLCGATVEDVGACRAALDTFKIGHGVSIPASSVCNFPNRMSLYNRQTPSESPSLPVYTGAYSMSAFVRASAATSSDLNADIQVVSPPSSALRSNITGWKRDQTKTLYSSISGLTRSDGMLYTNIVGKKSTRTSALEYEETLLGSVSGFTIVRRLLTALPDLTASISGWDYLELTATLVPSLIYFSDIIGKVIPVVPSTADIQASIVSTYVDDIGAIINSIPYVLLGGSLHSITPFDIYSSIDGYRPADIGAFMGGHYPEDINAVLYVNQPYGLKAWLRVGDNSSSIIQASITAYGGYLNLISSIYVYSKAEYDIGVNITCRIPTDLKGFLHGWTNTSISAFVKGVRNSDIGGWVTGWSRTNERDIGGFVRSAWAGEKTIDTSIYGWVSTHTSDKAYSKYLYKRFPEKVLFGTKKGLTILKIEIIWGAFPDLHASINGRPLFVSDLSAYILPASQIYSEMRASLNSVTKSIIISKVPINLVNISELSVYISAFSGYTSVYSSIVGKASISTSTGSGSGWVYRSSSIRFYIGSNKGLIVPPVQKSVLRPDVFLNYSQLPDLWGYVYGWEIKNLTATINIQPYSNIFCYITPQDTTHLSVLNANITSIYTKYLYASIVGSGQFVHLNGSISPIGGVSDLSASIFPYFKILGYRLLPVQTRPFLDLRAIINPSSYCSFISTYDDLSVFIRGGSILSNSGLLYASIYPTTETYDLSASITGRIYTRYKYTDIYFRTLVRSGSIVSASIIGQGFSFLGLSAYIKGLSHSNDFYASITPIRYRLNIDSSNDTIKVYKWEGANVLLYKELMLTFSSKVAEYVYDAIDSAVYEIGEGKWILNLAELTEVEGFYDRSPKDKNIDIDDLTEYNSIDEAIRAAIVILTEMYRTDIAASITATGGYYNLSSSIYCLRKDRVSDLNASVYLVTNVPDLYASITSYSGYKYLFTSVVGQNSGSPDINAEIRGVVYTGLNADISAVT